VSSTDETGWGIWLHAVRPVAELAELSASAEALGAAAILVADEGTDRDVFVTLTAIAQRTRRVLLFAAVTNPHSRHPVTTAAAFATLAELAPGRVVAGFGAGGSRVFGPLGLAPRRPYTALIECIEIVQALWRGETVVHMGELAAHGARLGWSPGPLRLAVAGRGPRAERLAAEKADWVVLAGRAVETVPGLVSRLRGLGRAAIAWNPVTAWTDAMRDELRMHLAYMAVDMPANDRVALGLDAEATSRLRSIITTRGPEAAAGVITDAVLERYAVVGTRAEVVTRLADLRARARPELLVFDAHDYSATYLEEVAALAVDAGARHAHNGWHPNGLDSHGRP
jgi:5,10-methylenetetrahydromethanopterin reductase